MSRKREERTLLDGVLDALDDVTAFLDKLVVVEAALARVVEPGDLDVERVKLGLGGLRCRRFPVWFGTDICCQPSG